MACPRENLRFPKSTVLRKREFLRTLRPQPFHRQALMTTARFTTLEELSLRHALPLDNLEKAKALVQAPNRLASVQRICASACSCNWSARAGRPVWPSGSWITTSPTWPTSATPAVQARRPPDQISRAVEVIAGLDPRPARFAVMRNHYVTRTSTWSAECGYVAVMNSTDLPHLRISNAYKDILAQPETGSEARSYIREKIHWK